MICPGWRARCCHCVRNIWSMWSFPSGEKSGCVCRPVSSGRNGRAYAGCSVLHLAGRYVGSVTVFRPVSRSKAWRFASVCCWTTTIRPDLTTFYACLTVIHALKSGFLILSRFACCVRLVISPTFPVSIAVCTIKVSLSMAWLPRWEVEILVMPILGQGKSHFFSDLDVMAIGPVVEDVADDFARYWYCKSVSPLQQVLDVPEGEMADRIELPASGITMP